MIPLGYATQLITEKSELVATISRKVDRILWVLKKTKQLNPKDGALGRKEGGGSGPLK